MSITKSLFGRFDDKPVYCFMLTNTKGNSVSIINYGATVISWCVSDKKNNVRDIVTGFNELDSYLKNDVYMGCAVGRYANRIANGKFTINQKEYQLNCNNGSNHLHGGVMGFDKVFWHAEIIEHSISTLSLTYFSKDGAEGYPGNLKVKIEYTYTDADELVINYFADTDAATPVNLTNHCYFNLSGNVSKNILDHSLQINAAYFTAVDDGQIPTGQLTAVEKTAFDFNTPKKIAHNFAETNNGYDHNYVLNIGDDELALAAILADAEDELQLHVFTTEPGIQLYTGNYLNGSLINKDEKPIGKHAALCLETQHFPDSPNHPHFPTTLLQPGEVFTSKTIYKITVA